MFETFLVPEPELAFHNGESHVDPKEGIFRYGPFDLGNPTRPDKVILGVIGSGQGLEKFNGYLNDCRNPIASKDLKKRKQYVPFPGIAAEVGLKVGFVTDITYQRKINQDFFSSINKSKPVPENIRSVVSQYIEEIEWLTKNKKQDVIICVIPESIRPFISNISQDEILRSLEETEEKNPADTSPDEKDFYDPDDFRRALKSASLQFGVPIQIIRERLWEKGGTTQDAATVAWNLFTALYYKAGGTPWSTMDKDFDRVCYAGVGFYRSLDRATLQTSVTQIFDHLGRGVILRGEPIETDDKDDRIPHLTVDQSRDLLNQAITEYRMATGQTPTRVALHKTSKFWPDEVEGFESALKSHGIQSSDMVAILDSSIGAFRFGTKSPNRGTAIKLSDEDILLYSNGFVPYYGVYPGPYVPEALHLKIAKQDSSVEQLLRDIMVLTKLNWNNTQLDRKYPITIECAWNVGHILAYMPEDLPINSRYAFYM